MRDELAGRVLDRLLTWTSEEQARWMADLRRLATYKFDTYEGFVAGERFFESLARWLRQFETDADRRRMIEFVRQELVFISSQEMNHAIACVYPDYIKPELISSVADMLGTSRFHVKEIVSSTAFRTLRRKTLYLGLSDGARLDRLRRSSPELSHEQFWLSPEIGSHAINTMRAKLAKAVEEQDLSGSAQFEQVVFVDDFYGSGTSLVHRKEDGSWGGKLARARHHLENDLKTGDRPIVTADANVIVVIYVLSSQARTHVASMLASFESAWRLKYVQLLPSDLVCTDLELRRICDDFFDDVLVDEHKQVRVPLGYKDAALPLVLHHNTPNNAIGPLWADSSDREGSLERHALFRRYERHHVDRP